MKTSWTDKPVTILGLSRSGIASAQYLVGQGVRCFLSETLPTTPANKESVLSLQALGVEVEMGGHSSRCFEYSDLVIVSPGIPPSSQILKELALSGKTIISEVELAYREANKPFIGITGTNGKTTTTTLISAILQANGKKAPTCGNIGTPIIGLVTQPVDYFVAEFSSFQLAYSPTLKTKIALFLNFRPDHLDWHGSVEAYKRAKFALFQDQHSPEWAILNADDPICRELAPLTQAQILWFSRNSQAVQQEDNFITLDAQGNVILQLKGKPAETILNVKDLKLVGAHNHENVLAAAGTCWLLGTPVNVIGEATTAFEGVEHRLEPVATIHGISYYNDSKATNPDAVLSALSAFDPKKVVLIAGGRDKKTDLQEFVASVKAHAHHVVLLGEAANRFALELNAGGYSEITFADSLEDAVLKATEKALPETPVLFSPACSSFDMFKNFEERGQAFKAIVQNLLAVSSR